MTITRDERERWRRELILLLSLSLSRLQLLLYVRTSCDSAAEEGTCEL